MNTLERMGETLKVVGDARQRFESILSLLMQKSGLTPEVYQRFLSMEFHLTRDVQRYFITAAAHHSLRTMKGLRRFLLKLANEEELHYVVAGNDLQKLGLPILPMPFDVELWHAFFSQVVKERPFVRLGAAIVLENMASEKNHALLKKTLNQPFLNASNTKFLVLHMHETLPHGHQIIQAISDEALTLKQLADLAEGARKGAILYLRMVEWAADLSALAALADQDSQPSISVTELAHIESFEMNELEDTEA